MNEETGKVSGNPATGYDVQKIMKALVTKGRATDDRDHAEAMLIEDMRKMMTWSEGQVSSAVDWATADIPDVESLRTVADHLEMRAYMAGAFTLWTR